MAKKLPKRVRMSPSEVKLAEPPKLVIQTAEMQEAAFEFLQAAFTLAAEALHDGGPPYGSCGCPRCSFLRADIRFRSAVYPIDTAKLPSGDQVVEHAMRLLFEDRRGAPSD